MFPAEVLGRSISTVRVTPRTRPLTGLPHFQPTDYDRALRDAQRKPVSLYVHVPFCRSLCYYCACNKIISKSATIADEYLDVLTQETALVAQAQTHLPVVQLAFGGGMNFLSVTQLTRLIRDLESKVRLPAGPEQGIELDPRYLDAAYIGALPGLGFNRVSYGVQDFDERAYGSSFTDSSRSNRLHRRWAARAAGINSISFDLVYGFANPVTRNLCCHAGRALSLEPDRLALFNYAHSGAFQGAAAYPDRYAALNPAAHWALPLRYRNAWLTLAASRSGLITSPNRVIPLAMPCGWLPASKFSRLQHASKYRSHRLGVSANQQRQRCVRSEQPADGRLPRARVLGSAGHCAWHQTQPRR